MYLRLRHGAQLASDGVLGVVCVVFWESLLVGPWLVVPWLDFSWAVLCRPYTCSRTTGFEACTKDMPKTRPFSKLDLPPDHTTIFVYQEWQNSEPFFVMYT
jgi:hypothetical protein